MPQVSADPPNQTTSLRGFKWLSAVVRDAARKHRAPKEVGAATGLGVFIGCLPFFGFHSIIAAGVAWLFGLNFIYMWMGTHVSNPFFAPFLAAASIAVGGYITGSSRATVAQWSLDWLVGSTVVGVILGSVVGIITASAVQRLQRYAPGAPENHND